MKSPSLTYSLADQDFARTKSIGIFNVSLQLCRALASNARLRQLSVLANRTLPATSTLPPHVRISFYERPIGARLQRIVWDQWQVYSEARRTGNEWLLLPKGFASFLRPPPVRLAVYVHDVMHDVYASDYPGQMPPFENFYFRRSMVASIRHAELIFTNTEFTASEVRRAARKYSLREPQVVCAGIGFDKAPPPALEREKRIVALTSRWPHKRADLALSWLQRWQDESGFDGFLDLVGGLPANVRCPMRANWKHHERLGESDYRELLRRAKVLVYFSDYEGFGMPPVEAALAGACPVYSALPSTREAMANAGIAFCNTEYESFRNAMDQAWKVSPEKIEGWASQLLARHQWSLVAERVMTALQQAGPSGRATAGP